MNAHAWPEGYEPVVRRWAVEDDASGVDGAEPGTSSRRGVDPAVAERQFDDLVERVVEAIEERVVNELERRGRRHLPEVF